MGWVVWSLVKQKKFISSVVKATLQILKNDRILFKVISVEIYKQT